jgi:hypothetical protein
VAHVNDDKTNAPQCANEPRPTMKTKTNARPKETSAPARQILPARYEEFLAWAADNLTAPPDENADEFMQLAYDNPARAITLCGGGYDEIFAWEDFFVARLRL